MEENSIVIGEHGISQAPPPPEKVSKAEIRKILATLRDRLTLGPCRGPALMLKKPDLAGAEWDARKGKIRFSQI